MPAAFNSSVVLFFTGTVACVPRELAFHRSTVSLHNSVAAAMLAVRTTSFPWDLSRLRHSGVKLRNHFLRGLGTRLCAGQQLLVILSVWRSFVQLARGLCSGCQRRAWATLGI